MARIIVLHADVSEIGGAELLLAEQSRWLQARGHEVRVVVCRATGSAWRTTFDGLPVQVLGDTPKIERLRTPSQMQGLIAAARRALADAEIVVAHNFPAAPLAGLASPAGARTVWYCHEPYRSLHPEATYPMAASRLGVRDASDGPTRQFARRARRRQLTSWLMPWTAARRRALAAWDASGVAALDVVVSNSAFSNAMLEAALGRRSDAIIPPAVAMPTFDAEALRSRRGIDRSAPQLLAQTRLGVPKNLDVIIRGVGMLRATNPGIRLHIAGDGPQRQALESLAQAVAPGSVQFHGYVQREALHALREACDIFALLPVDEPFGMVFPEAAVRGLLLIGPDHGGPVDILGNGAYGAVCNAFSAEAFAAAVRGIVARPDAELTEQRVRAAEAMHARYAPTVVFPAFERVVTGQDA